MITVLRLVTASLAAGLLLAQEAPQPPQPPEPPAAPNAPDTSRAERDRARAAREKTRAAQEKVRAAQEKVRAAQEKVLDAGERVRAMQRATGLSLTGSSSYIGIGVADIDAERAKALKLPDVHGAEVRNVADDSPAAKAGIKDSDVILEYNGQRVEGQDQLVRMVRETPVGREARLGVWRNGAAQSVTVTVAKRPGNVMVLNDGHEFSFHMPEIEIPPMPPMPDMPNPMMSWRNSVLGIECESLTSQLAQYFGVKEGVLVRSVMAGTAAEKAGIKAGDVILKVDNTAVTTPREITSMLRGRRASPRTIPVVVMRDHKEMTVTVTFEAASQPPSPPGVRSSSGLPDDDQA